MKNILLTGGTGYIGSHTCVELLKTDVEVTVVDNLSNSQALTIDRIEKLTTRKVKFLKLDIRNRIELERLFSEYSFDAVIHFAGLKAVGESVTYPLAYYENNVVGTINLLQTMQKFSVKNLVFSSSATVYGDPDKLPICEDAPRSATNPYGQTKLIIENILSDLYHSDNAWKIARLRYFNPVGAHPSGLIGEQPSGIPNNLMPYISQVASGIRDKLHIFGNDYPTCDGTGVRDYIHVMDLAAGHVAALDYLNRLRSGELISVNLGTGNGISVLELLNAYENTIGRSIPYVFDKRRPGDVASCYADVSLANKLLNWKAKLGLKEMCEDAWRWQTQNPSGY